MKKASSWSRAWELFTLGWAILALFLAAWAHDHSARQLTLTRTAQAQSLPDLKDN